MDKRIIGHRGARGLWPENSLTGFRNVLALGVHGVEFDIHPTRDGRLAVIHDPLLQRTTNGTGPVSALSLAELQGLRLHGAEEGVPSFDQVLDILVPDGLELHIELKADAADRPYAGLEAYAVAEVRRRGIEARTVLTSFWLDVHERLRAAWPNGRLLASLNAASVARQGGLDRVLDALAELRVDLIAVHKDLLAAELDTFVQRVGPDRLCAWVVNEPAEIERWLASEVAYITSDRPDRFPLSPRKPA